MRLLLEPIEVEQQNTLPKQVIWRHQPFAVESVEERWLWHGNWWTTPHLEGHQRRYFKVAVVSLGGNPSQMEVYEVKADWVLSQWED